MAFWDFLFKGSEKPSPSDIVKNDLIKEIFQGGIYQDGAGRWRIKRELLWPFFNDDPELWLCIIPNTNSMDPVFDKEHINIYMKGYTAPDHSLLIQWLANEWTFKRMANIIVYQPGPYTPVVHRLKKVEDVYPNRRWTFLGDNSAGTDPHRATDQEIKWVLIGTIY